MNQNPHCPFCPVVSHKGGNLAVNLTDQIQHQYRFKLGIDQPVFGDASRLISHPSGHIVSVAPQFSRAHNFHNGQRWSHGQAEGVSAASTVEYVLFGRSSGQDSGFSVRR